MSERKHVLSTSKTDQQRTAKPTQPVETTPQSTDLLSLQHTIGNFALQRLLAEGHPLVAPHIQTKMHVGAAHDSYENEADTVAHAVMSMPDPSVQRDEETVQTKRIGIQRAEADDEDIQAKRGDTESDGVDMMGEFDVA